MAAMSVSDPAAAFFPSPLALPHCKRRLSVSPLPLMEQSRPTMDNILFSIEKSGGGLTAMTNNLENRAEADLLSLSSKFDKLIAPPKTHPKPANKRRENGCNLARGRGNGDMS